MDKQRNAQTDKNTNRQKIKKTIRQRIHIDIQILQATLRRNKTRGKKNKPQTD